MTTPPMRYGLPIFILSLVLFIACGDNKSNAGSASDDATKNAAEQAEEDAADVANTEKRLYKIKSGKIVYKHTGKQQGTTTLYVDDYGDVVVMDIDRKSKVQDEKKVIIWKDGKTTVFDHNAKTVWNSPIRIRETEPAAIVHVAEKDLERIYTKQPDEEIAGKTCSVYKMNTGDVSYALWNGIELREENSGYIKEAISVEEGTTIPEALLVAPEGYTQQ